MFYEFFLFACFCFLLLAFASKIKNPHSNPWEAWEDGLTRKERNFSSMKVGYQAISKISRFFKVLQGGEMALEWHAPDSEEEQGIQVAQARFLSAWRTPCWGCGTWHGMAEAYWQCGPWKRIPSNSRSRWKTKWIRIFSFRFGPSNKQVSFCVYNEKHPEKVRSLLLKKNCEESPPCPLSSLASTLHHLPCPIVKKVKTTTAANINKTIFSEFSKNPLLVSLRYIPMVNSINQRKFKAD